MRVAGQPVEIAGAKRRALLALLLLHANEVVASTRLVDDLWGDRAPRNANAALQNHVSRLRKVLGADVIGTRAWGYVLRAEPDSIDLQRFQGLVQDAESRPASERAAALREALALWRGAPLADLASERSLGAEIARLEELRLSALERRIDADLERGAGADLVAELEALVTAEPLRERPRGQLILALYRAGRQAEALEVYRETRRVLAEELGLDPSPALRELERAVLRHDPALVPAVQEAERRPRVIPKPGRRRFAVPVAVGGLAAVAMVVAAAVWLGRDRASTPISARAGVTTAYTTTLVNGRRRIQDGFESRSTDLDMWYAAGRHDGASLVHRNGRLEITVAADALSKSASSYVGGHYSTNCGFPGDFDARVQMSLLDWPAGNGVFAGLSILGANVYIARRSAAGTVESLVGAVGFNTPSVFVARQDRDLRLRLTRVGDTLSVRFWNGARWETVASEPSPGRAVIALQAEVPRHEFGRKRTRVAFDDFVVEAAETDCPPP